MTEQCREVCDNPLTINGAEIYSGMQVTGDFWDTLAIMKISFLVEQYSILL